MTPEASKDLQSLFEYAARTLPERVLENKQLAWRKKTSKVIISEIWRRKNTFAKELNQLMGKLRGNGQTWSTASARGGRGSIQAGGHRGGTTWTKATPTGAQRGARIGVHRHSGMEGFLTAIGKGGVWRDVMELLNSGVQAGIEVKASLAAAEKPGDTTAFKAEAKSDLLDAEATHKLVIKEVAELVKSTGLVDAALAESAESIAKDVLGTLPIIGFAATLSASAGNGIRAAVHGIDRYKVGKHASIIRPGAPQQALVGVQSMLNRKIAQYSWAAGQDLAVAGVQGAGLFVDFGVATGPTAGVLNAALKVIRSFVFSMLDFLDFNRGQRRLIRRQYDISIVEDCPVLGAYLITEAETSTLLAFLSGGTLSPNWMDEVERLKGQVDTVVRLANKCILASPFKLMGQSEKYYDGTTKEIPLKGEHMLDFRRHKIFSRYLHEAKLVLKRDRSGLKFLNQKLRRDLGL